MHCCCSVFDAMLQYGQSRADTVYLLSNSGLVPSRQQEGSCTVRAVVCDKITGRIGH
jgi:hypothetical protein